MEYHLKGFRNIGFVCGSDGRDNEAGSAELKQLTELMSHLKISFRTSPLICEDAVFSATPQERAEIINHYFSMSDIDALVDISGGSISNTILDYLDYEQIRLSGKPYIGYSDLTAVLNAIYSMTGQHCFLYQIRNLLQRSHNSMLLDGYEFFQKGTGPALHFVYEFLQGASMQGIGIGGNIRSFLKLAGTRYMPDPKGKILLLEGRSTSLNDFLSYLYQLKQNGVFELLNGVVFGQFTKIDRLNQKEEIKRLVLESLKDTGIPIALTTMIGHSYDSRVFEIGRFYRLNKDT